MKLKPLFQELNFNFELFILDKFVKNSKTYWAKIDHPWDPPDPLQF